MKKFLLLLALIPLLSACGSGAENPTNEIWSEVVETSNGPVVCILYEGYSKGGITCDWSNQ